MITSMDQVTVVRRLLECLHAMKKRQLACEETEKELENEQRLITLNNNLSPRAYLAIRTIESILLSDHRGDLENFVCLSSNASTFKLKMENFDRWAENVNWLLSVMEGFRP